jgi:DNA-binding XRE family transcriptional regulator
MSNKRNELSVSQYANMVGLTRQAILAQIKGNRLANGVIARMIGKTYVIYIPKGHPPSKNILTNKT